MAIPPLPGSPEDGKGYKPQNSSGCCGGGCHYTPPEVKPPIKKGCSIFYKTNCSRSYIAQNNQKNHKSC